MLILTLATGTGFIQGGFNRRSRAGMNVLKPFIVLSGILAVVGGVKAHAEGRQVDISPHAQLGLAKLYANRPFLVTIYVTSMERYAEEALARSVEGAPFTPRFQPRDSGFAPTRWTWFAANGNSVRRIGASRFRIYLRNYQANWFSTLDCTELDWPVFVCRDGARMTMRVPNANSVVFGGVEYKVNVRGY